MSLVKSKLKLTRARRGLNSPVCSARSARGTFFRICRAGIKVEVHGAKLRRHSTSGFVRPSWLIAALVVLALTLPVIGLQHLAQSRNQALSPEGDPARSGAPSPAPAATQPVRVVALGRIEPSTGVIQVGGPINEILGQLLVQEGDWVEKGQIIGYLRTHAERRSELENAQTQLQVAQAKLRANTQYSQSQVQELTTESNQVPLVQNSAISAQQAQIEVLKSEQKLAQTELNRYQHLVEQGATPRNELDQRQSKVEQISLRIVEAQATLQRLMNTRDRDLANVNAQVNTAQLNTSRVQVDNEVNAAQQAVNLAKVRLENTIIISPRSGRILRILTEPGESIGDDGRGKGSIVELADTTSMQVVAEVNESDIRLVKLGQRTEIASRNQAFEGKLAGTVTEIGRQIFKNNVLNDDPSALSDARVIQVKVRLDNSTAVAKFTNLQVDIQIQIGNAQTGNAQTGNAQTGNAQTGNAQTGNNG